METYTYALVRIKGFATGYNYISEDRNLKTGSYVLVPFGAGNEECAGEVLDVHDCTAEEAPFPVERTKHIIRKLSRQEYAAVSETACGNRWGESSDEKAERREMEQYLDNTENYDYEYLFEWACEHHDLKASPAMIQLVIRCYELCAEQRMPAACLNLGTFYYNGVFVPQDYKKAAALYKIAADNGIGVAIRNLGYCYYYGRHQVADFQKAWVCFNRGALLFEDANCLYKLGDMYQYGEAVEKNEKYAYILYRRALISAKRYREYAFCKPDIWYRLGICCLEGIGTGRDIWHAHHFLQKALDGFYARRETDSFAGGLIGKTRKAIRRAESLLDQDILRR